MNPAISTPELLIAFVAMTALLFFVAAHAISLLHEIGVAIFPRTRRTHSPSPALWLAIFAATVAIGGGKPSAQPKSGGRSSPESALRIPPDVAADAVP